MIHSINANNDSFKSINFSKGMNIILADRTMESKNKDSTNGLGKSTLIDIIDFCLGGKLSDTLTKNKLKDWTFTLGLDLNGNRYDVSRSVKKTNNIILCGDFNNWPIKPEINDDGNYFLPNLQWKNILGYFIFNTEIQSKLKYSPSFRSLISYRIRKVGKKGGYFNSFLQNRMQQPWDVQVNTTYLLNLNWTLASQKQDLKDKEKSIQELKKAIKSDIFISIMGNIGDLEAKKIQLIESIKTKQSELQHFKILKEYAELEYNVNTLTKKIHDVINESITKKRLLEHYESILHEDVDISPNQLIKIYSEAKMNFPDQVSKKLNDVFEFHHKIIKNRSDFLKQEITLLKQNISKLDDNLKLFEYERSNIMDILKKHGALEEYMEIQSKYQKSIAELEDVKNKLSIMKKIEQNKNDLKIENILLRQKIENDLNERQTQREDAILTFNKYSKVLYESPGTLSINVDDSGYKFDINIERSSSQGFENMKIFCYDLMLAKLWANRTKNMPFLIHDNAIFAGVDARQIASALQLAQKISDSENFQYICTMNSDSIPSSDFDLNFNFNEFVKIRFTDVTPNGGLLGFRF